MKPSQVEAARISYPDAEMHDAADELRQAETMFNNAPLGWRQIEANYRISAAQARINAIRTERRDGNDLETISGAAHN